MGQPSRRRQTQARQARVRLFQVDVYKRQIQLCNRLAWKNPMDMDTPMAKICSGIKHQNTYKGTLIDLHLWGLVEILYWTKNQHRAHRIRLNPEILPDENINLAIFDTIEMSKLNTQTAKITHIEVSKLNKQRLSNEYAMNKQRLSSDSYSKQYKLPKPSKLKKLSQTDERNFLEILDNEEGNVCLLYTSRCV